MLRQLARLTRPVPVAGAGALAVGVYLVQVGGWPIVLIGLASLACALPYTGGPFPLPSHGLGDAFVFVFFGLVAVPGMHYVQRLACPPAAFRSPWGADGRPIRSISSSRSRSQFASLDIASRS